MYVPVAKRKTIEFFVAWEEEASCGGYALVKQGYSRGKTVSQAVRKIRNKVKKRGSNFTLRMACPS